MGNQSIINALTAFKNGHLSFPRFLNELQAISQKENLPDYQKFMESPDFLPMITDYNLYQMMTGSVGIEEIMERSFSMFPEFTLTFDQILAAQSAINILGFSDNVVVSGFAGSGKTKILGNLIKAQFPNAVVCAPASTDIQVGAQPNSNLKMAENAANALLQTEVITVEMILQDPSLVPDDAVLIIDEAMYMANDKRKALYEIRKGKKTVYIGDPVQLSSSTVATASNGFFNSQSIIDTPTPYQFTWPLTANYRTGIKDILTVQNAYKGKIVATTDTVEDLSYSKSKKGVKYAPDVVS